ncbi:magnesium transporter MgtE N-terminal domain-containing protein [Nostocoides australiense]|uniref:Putative magnesium (Mg2+) transporter n=1 Tax=Nostocoides australiense Ben110 TaxID=1193182 RepID=W6JT57_9MICO|nr:CBS domain-containing protein [Tetrasphaera australiensis]MCA0290180.1 CBS domain-containing protein [Actinomycetota bacterium]CCH71927.1 putative magnesium (Mg2+) transporter [Tetrasphaera australiensis Ben110]HPF81037.1 CBS domain-containing protein [Tetrasphaera australiensis]HRW02021.1 CBS domain-containing protein [Tetrasphaera sp.]
MSAPVRVFVARLAGLEVFDPLGDRVGRVRDVVITFSQTRRPRVLGMVVEVAGKRRVFVPMTRVTSVDGAQVITTGLVNMRRFEQRQNETLVLAELLERQVTARTDKGLLDATVEDIGIEQDRARDWSVTKVFCREGKPQGGLARLGRRRSATFVVPVEDVTGLHVESEQQPAARLLEAYEDLKAADLAEAISDLSPKRRLEVAAALDDERLADVIEELPEDAQVEIMTGLETERAADILEAMQPDDAADLLSELPEEQQEQLLMLMEPDEAEDLRRLLAYDDNTAGGLMTTEPVILGPEASIAEALAVVRREELPTALATTVFVTRGPHETPTGRYLGMVHIQRLLREPPHASIGGILDKDVDPLEPDLLLGEVARRLANYNMIALPVVDEGAHLIGAVTVDDVLDHILPEHWREDRHELTQSEVSHG